LILYFDFFSGFSPLSTLSAPILALVLVQPRLFLLLPPQAPSKKAATHTAVTHVIIRLFIFSNFRFGRSYNVIFKSFGQAFFEPARIHDIIVGDPVYFAMDKIL
jgi:hypothetical protein